MAHQQNWLQTCFSFHTRLKTLICQYLKTKTFYIIKKNELCACSWTVEGPESDLLEQHTSSLPYLGVFSATTSRCLSTQQQASPGSEAKWLWAFFIPHAFSVACPFRHMNLLSLCCRYIVFHCHLRVPQVQPKCSTIALCNACTLSLGHVSTSGFSLPCTWAACCPSL